MVQKLVAIPTSLVLLYKFSILKSIRNIMQLNRLSAILYTLIIPVHFFFKFAKNFQHFRLNYHDLCCCNQRILEYALACNYIQVQDYIAIDYSHIVLIIADMNGLGHSRHQNLPSSSTKIHIQVRPTGGVDLIFNVCIQQA